MKPVLKTEYLSREVEGGRRVVDAVSLSVDQGEIVSITGPSGSGKSSFLRLLNRLDEPTAGTVLLDGVDYRSLAPKDLRRRVGLVLQNPFLFPGTIADNLRFGPTQRGIVVPPVEISLWLEQVGLAGYEEQDVARLSGGEAQRVSIARTLINDPEILLLDEPTSALDDKSKEHVEQLIAGLIRQEKMTCLIVTHDEAQAARLANRTVIIDHGKVVADKRIPHPYA